MNKPWQVIVVLIGIFTAGAVAGGFITLRFYKDRLTNRPVPEEWAPKHLKKLNDRLALTPEQETLIKPIVRRSMEEINRIRNSSMAETKTLVEGMQREVSVHLTAEQKTKFEQMNRELREAREAREAREKAERAKREQGERPPGGPLPPAAGPAKAPPPEKTPGS